ncbi:MAG: HAMP domain-containing histidine kinase [Clostridium sp.]|nr:HAMP domain-containing histidine kinase [Clostridium sp.]MCM1399447.1 HAMP domain-containing histidine kinase [Clostridium sp.]MCM1460001.1 HAMP domain-containing histidine kinase [Bacteroides sp.]
MNIWMMISSILLIILVVLILYLIALKKQIRRIKEELTPTREREYNKQLTISLFDRDLTKLSTEINYNLDYQKKLKYDAALSEMRLKQSVSDIAHDLRTPLTVIKGNLQMLDAGDAYIPKEKAYLNTCREKADVLKSMVDDFFEMSVLESDSTDVTLKEIDATKLLMQFVVDHEAVIREHGLTPDIRLLEKTVSIRADLQMLTRMLGNMLGNAIKYARNSFGIYTDIRTDGSFDIIFENVVSDTDKIDVNHMFERTYRGSRARTGQGAGLGLYIVKLLAEKQNANVYAEVKDGKLITHMIFKTVKT